jgi:hypothetical protein
MVTHAVLNLEQVQRIRQMLQEAPPSTSKEVSRREAIRLLATDIAAMRSKGYSMAQIAAMLVENGLSVSAGVLKGYLRDARGERAARTAGRKSKRGGRERGARPSHAAGGKEAPVGAAAGSTLEGTAGGTGSGASSPSADDRPADAGAASRVERGGREQKGVGSKSTSAHATTESLRPMNEGDPGAGAAGARPALPAWGLRVREDSEDL